MRDAGRKGRRAGVHLDARLLRAPSGHNLAPLPCLSANLTPPSPHVSIPSCFAHPCHPTHPVPPIASQVVLLQSTLAAQASEAKRLSSAVGALSADIADKKTAIDIDWATRSIESPRGGPRQEWQYTSKGPVVAPEWRGSTTSICAAARQVVAVSVRLRSKSAQVEAECLRKEIAAKKELLRVHTLSVNRLRATVAESRHHIAQLDDALAELGSLKVSTEAAMADKEDACTVTTDRLNTRNLRPDRERVHDQAQVALQNELRVLTSAAHELARQIQRCALFFFPPLSKVTGARGLARGCTPTVGWTILLVLSSRWGEGLSAMAGHTTRAMHSETTP